MFILVIFFFSSRRRHTRCSRDWSSDVCSSDLWAFYEDAMTELLEDNRFEVTFMGVDTTVARFDELREVELFLRDSVVRKWVEDGRWEELADSFAQGENHLTLSYLVVKARKLAGAYRAE